MNKQAILDAAVSPFAEYCNGFSFGNNGNCYILTPLLAVGKDKIKFTHQGSTCLDEINGFDLAEVEAAYIGQLNLIKVSSFCGPQGLVWGYDIAQKDIARLEPLLAGYHYKNISGHAIQVYSAWPLIEASVALYGSRDTKRFPIIPGSHVPAAYKSYSFCNLLPLEEVRHIYCTIGLGVPKDRNKNAVLVMEDVGWMPRHLDRPDFSEQHQHLLDSMVRSIVQIGENQLVEYENIYVAFKEIPIESQEVGCALVVAPYISLARHAIPIGGTEQLAELNLDQWQTSLNISTQHGVK
ncbi:MAG: histidine decarboxylase, pyruvoyl type, partial [Pseudomonadota bacterium]